MRLGNRGGLMRARSEGKTVCQGSVEAVTRCGASVTAAALIARSFKNCLRVLIYVCALQDCRINKIDKIVSFSMRDILFLIASQAR